MKVLITGASGFIGSHLAEYLLSKGVEVRCLVRTSSNLRWIADLDVECFYGSLQLKDTIIRALEDVDYVYHLAGVTKALTADTFNEHNVQGTQNLVHAILESKVSLKRFLFVSSQAVAGPSSSLNPTIETDKENPVTEYGNSKLEAEKIVKSLKGRVPFTIIRPPVVYGPRDTDVLQFIKTVKMGVIPKLDGREKYVSLVYVKDLVRAIHLAATRKAAEGKTYFVANPQPYSWDAISKAALKHFNKKGVSLSIPSFLLDGLSFAADGFGKLTGKASIFSRQRVTELKQDFWVCSPRLIKKDLRFESKISLDEGIQETINWYREKKWL